MSLNMRHQLICKGTKGSIVIAEQYMEWDMSEKDLENPIKIMGLIKWEEDTFIKGNIETKHTVFPDKEEWDAVQKEPYVNLTKWLQSAEAIISIKKLESVIGCPPSTLKKVVKNGSEVPNKWKEPLHKYIQDKLVNPFFKSV